MIKFVINLSDSLLPVYIKKYVNRGNYPINFFIYLLTLYYMVLQFYKIMDDIGLIPPKVRRTKKEVGRELTFFLPIISEAINIPKFQVISILFFYF